MKNDLRAQVDMLTADLEAANKATMETQAALATAKASEAAARQGLSTANARVTELETLIGDATNPAATSLRGMLADAKIEAAAAQAALQAARAQLATAQTEANTQRQRAEDAETRAQDAEQEAQTLEANQRAENLKEAFPGGDATTDLPPISATASPVTITVPTRGRLTLTSSGHGTATLSGQGLRTATMLLTSGGDSGKTVVYTDRELSRPLLEHYDGLRDSDDMTRFNLTGNLLLAGGVITQVSAQWGISHGVATSVATENGTLPANANTARDPKDSYAGSLHGISGRFVCSGANCQVQVTPTYAPGSVNDRHALEQVAVAATASGFLHFRPSGSPSIQLYEGGPVGADDEYMVFGYWRENPTSVAADYDIGVFAQGFGTEPTADISARYDGTAVGMYVEQDPNNAVDTHRQGEFTADVDLSINGDPTTLTGTIDDFVTTPTGGSAAPRTSARWLVKLETGNKASIENLTGTKSGSWQHTFVPAHADASDATPPAVTGTFNTRILDFVHLLGAFGAEKR